MDREAMPDLSRKEVVSGIPASRFFCQKVSSGVILSVLAQGHERPPGPFFPFPFLVWVYPHETGDGFGQKHYLWVKNHLDWTMRLKDFQEGVILAVTTKALHSFYSSGKDDMPGPVARVMNNPAMDLSKSESTDSICRSILFQLKFKIPDGFELPLIYKKLALQLLAHELDVLAALSEGTRSCRVSLSSGDQERLEKSRLILKENLEFPPGIKMLARMAGLNEHKLKTGFKQLFGEPPITYLRRLRMEKAKALLQKPGVSVTQAALQVGYSNPSAFSASFAKHYGYPPGRLKKNP